MSKTIQQVHEAAKAFRAQFRPLIEILDEVAELTNLSNTRQELEASIAALSNARVHEEEKLAEYKKLVSKAADEAESMRRQGELQSRQVAEDISRAREVAAEEAARVRAEVSSGIAEQQAAGAAAVAEAEAKVAGLKEEAGVLEVRLDMLRKAISSIVVGATE